MCSVGYQGRSLADLCARVSGAGVEQLVDVRAVPWSQRPQFRKGSLTEALASAPACVTSTAPPPQTGREPSQPQSAADCADLYRQHLARRAEILGIVREMLERARSALLCYEAARDACHRGVLLAALEQLGPLRIVDL